MIDNCNQSEDLNRRIGGCTAFIRTHQKQDAELAKAHSYRGQAYFDQGRYRSAIRDFDRVLELVPESHNNYVRRAGALIKLKKYGDALADLLLATDLYPEFAENPRVLFRLLSAYNGLRDDEGLLATTDRALALAVWNEDEVGLIWSGRATALVRLKQYEASLAAFDNAVAAGFSEDWVFDYRGTVRCNLGDKAGALSDWTRAIAIGGPEKIRRTQEHLVKEGRFDGPADGSDSAAFRLALEAHTVDHGC
ncbi:MAG: tetratricopeptide repeat protein [Pseudomonadota bacterium]